VTQMSDVDISLSAPTTVDADEFIAEVLASRLLHRSWIDLPDSTERFDAYLIRAARDDQASYLVRHTSCGDLVGVVNINNIVRGALQSGYLGYATFASHVGRGLMTVVFEPSSVWPSVNSTSTASRPTSNPPTTAPSPSSAAWDSKERASPGVI
jgi:hypothetical protein